MSLPTGPIPNRDVDRYLLRSGNPANFRKKIPRGPPPDEPLFAIRCCPDGPVKFGLNLALWCGRLSFPWSVSYRPPLPKVAYHCCSCYGYIEGLLNGFQDRKSETSSLQVKIL